MHDKLQGWSAWAHQGMRVRGNKDLQNVSEGPPSGWDWQLAHGVEWYERDKRVMLGHPMLLKRTHMPWHKRQRKMSAPGNKGRN